MMPKKVRKHCFFQDNSFLALVAEYPTQSVFACRSLAADSQACRDIILSLLAISAFGLSRAQPRIGSRPIATVSDPALAKLSSFSFPGISLWPGTQIILIWIFFASLSSIRWHSRTSFELVLCEMRALIAVWLSEYMVAAVISLWASIQCAALIIAYTSFWIIDA